MDEHHKAQKRDAGVREAKIKKAETEVRRSKDLSEVQRHSLAALFRFAASLTLKAYALKCDFGIAAGRTLKLRACERICAELLVCKER